MNIDDLISRAESLSQAGSDTEALSLAVEAASLYPKELKVWVLSGHLHALSNDFDKAVADLTEAISLNSAEPALFFDRGRYALEAGDFRAAASDFTMALGLCDQHGNDYYREALHFMRAEAYLSLRQSREALADLSHVNDGCTLWTYKLRTKHDLLKEVQRVHGR